MTGKQVHTKYQGRLSRFSPGGILELLYVSFPLILSLASGGLMLIVDRLFLAHLSSEALAAAVSANMPVWTVQISSITLVSIAQVFVGQYNGAKQPEKIGPVVWQMIWFTGVLGIGFLFLTVLGNQWLFNNHPVKELARDYYTLMMAFGFLSPLAAAISTFYVGRGKTSFVMMSVLTGNIVNAILNPLLIFGLAGWMVPLGVRGAALATIIGQLIQAIMLASIFLKKENRTLYSTDNYKLDLPLMRKTLSIGYPAALDRLVNVFGWTLFIKLIESLGTVPLTAIAITQSMMMFFSFISQGVGRAVSSVAANAIGAKEWHLLNKVSFSALTLNSLLFVLYGIFFLVYPEQFSTLFLPDQDSDQRDAILELVLFSCNWLWIGVFIDSARWVFIGLLTAVGDTRFVMWLGSTSIWIFAILPTYIFVVHFGIPVSYSWAFSSLYYLVICTAYAWRFSRGTWKGKLMIEDIPPTKSVLATNEVSSSTS